MTSAGGAGRVKPCTRPRGHVGLGIILLDLSRNHNAGKMFRNFYMQL